MRLALFVTCLVDGMFPEVGKATVGLLERLGQRVEVPLAQTCCGQAHINTGYAREALPLVRRHVASFAGYDAVVVPSGPCAGSVRHQHAWVAEQAGDERLTAAAADLASRTHELSEFLVEVLGVTDVGAYFPHRVTYHPTCHSLRLLRVGDRPLRLLREVRGIDLVELPEARAHRPSGRDPHLHRGPSRVGREGSDVTRTFLGMPTAPPGIGHLRGERPFPEAARAALADPQLRRNLGKATATIRARRAAVVGSWKTGPSYLRANFAVAETGTLVVHGQVLQFQAEQPLVGAKHRQPEPFGKAEGDPLVTAAAQGGRRAGLVGDAAVATAKDEDLDELVEDDPVGDALPVAAERVVDVVGGQQGRHGSFG
jgi:hypothetical protein